MPTTIRETIPVIRQCTVSKCAYNVDNQCHTPAITVGEGTEPVCDTFLCDVCVKTADKGGPKASNAFVGACKVAYCEHNRSLECAAGSIKVDVQKNKPECDTFAPEKGGRKLVKK
ncbi:MAG: DUF1540 domain-containing protein [Deltaproteobacteria bacterium]